jgi:drug/metabolite transporter (DMT)-like permease
MSAILGELAALATSVLWSTSSTLFTLGSRRQTPQIVNRIRLVGAVILLGLSHLIFLGYLIPRETTFIWLLLGLSGIIGLALGDAFLFWAYIKMGPRVSMLLMSLAPIVTTSAAWVLFDERLSLLKMIAIIVTLTGVGWVVLDKGQNHEHFKITPFGILLGLGAMLGQAIQLLMAGYAMDHMHSANPPLAATFIRIVWGASAVWFATLVLGRTWKTVKALKDRRFVGFVALATVFGPFLGIWASFIAIDNVEMGIASTLMSLSPLMMIPISRVVFKEKVSVRSVTGTVVAMIGVAGLFLL